MGRCPLKTFPCLTAGILWNFHRYQSWCSYLYPCHRCRSEFVWRSVRYSVTSWIIKFMSSKRLLIKGKGFIILFPSQVIFICILQIGCKIKLWIRYSFLITQEITYSFIVCPMVMLLMHLTCFKVTFILFLQIRKQKSMREMSMDAHHCIWLSWFRILTLSSCWLSMVPMLIWKYKFLLWKEFNDVGEKTPLHYAVEKNNF